MTTNATARSREMTLVWSAAFWPLQWRAALDAYAEKELAKKTYNGVTLHE